MAVPSNLPLEIAPRPGRLANGRAALPPRRRYGPGTRTPPASPWRSLRCTPRMPSAKAMGLPGFRRSSMPSSFPSVPTSRKSASPEVPKLMMAAAPASRGRRAVEIVVIAVQDCVAPVTKPVEDFGLCVGDVVEAVEKACMTVGNAGDHRDLGRQRSALISGAFMPIPEGRRTRPATRQASAARRDDC